MAQLIKGSEYLIRQVNKEEVFTPEDFTDEHRSILETVDDFVDKEVMPDVEAIDHQEFDKVVKHLKKCGELGFLMTDAPEEFGGMDLDKVTSMILAERMARSGSFSVAFTAHTGIGTLPLIYYGNQEQKERYLEKIITGEWLAAYCLTEPGSGSDALGARATARLSEDGKHYVLNGTKQFITNASFADIFTVFAKIDGEAFTGFLVERSFAGVSIGPEEKKMGIKGSSTCQVILDNVQVPVENLLGEAGKGHKIAFNILNVGRLKLGASVNGAAKEALAVGIKYTNERKQFNLPISKFGALQEKMANLTAAIFASDALVYRATGDIDNIIATHEKGNPDYQAQCQAAFEDFAAECSIAKVFCSEVLADVVDEVVQMHGGYGFIAEYPAERFYRDERINRIFEGTNEINRLLVPGTILRKAMKGELPLQAEAMKAFGSLTEVSFEELDESQLFAAEKKLLADQKKLFLILSGAAVQKYMDKLQREQEMLMASADIAIQIYAAESAMLRAEKMYEKASDEKKALLKAAVQVFFFNSNEVLASAARRGAFFVEEDDNLKMILSGIRRYTKYDATGLLKSKRLLAKASIEAEKYIF